MSTAWTQAGNRKKNPDSTDQIPLDDGAGAKHLTIEDGRRKFSSFAVATMADLMDEDLSRFDDGDRIQLLGFYAAGDGGGGSVYWDAGEDKANHNGGTIIDPTHSVTPGSAGWWTAENTGTGCWKRGEKGYAQLEEWGGKVKPYDSTAAMNAAKSAKDWIKIGEGTFLLDNVGNPAGRSMVVEGAGTGDTIIQAVTDYAFKIDEFAEPFQGEPTIKNLTFDGESNTLGGLYITPFHRVKLDNVVFRDCDKGIEKDSSFGNKFNNVIFRRNNYGMYAVANSVHIGLDIFDKCGWFQNKIAGVYKNGGAEGGIDRYSGCHIENNAGFGLMYIGFNNPGDISRPVKIESTWIEGNQTSASVTVDGTSYTPRDLYIEDSVFSIEGSYIDEVEIKGSTYLATRNASLFNLTKTGNNYILDLDNMVGDQKDADYPVKGLSFRNTNRRASAIDIRNRPLMTRSKTNLIRRGSNVFNPMFSANSTNTISQVSDGVLPVNNCYEVTINDASGNVIQSDMNDRADITNGKYYVITIALKKISGNISQVSIQWANSQQFVLPTHILNDGWTTYKVIAQCQADDLVYGFVRCDDTGVFRVSAVQFVEFDTKSEAFQFTMSDEYAVDQDYLDNGIFDAQMADYTDPSTATAQDIANALINAGLMKSS